MDVMRRLVGARRQEIISIDQLDSMPEQQSRYKRSSWPATAELQRPAPPPHFLHGFDGQLLASVLSIALICCLCISLDYGLHPELSSTYAFISSPGSTSYHSIAVHSTVLDVDIPAEVLTLELRVQQHGEDIAAACSAAGAADLQLAVGTAHPQGARPSAVIPLCPHPAHSRPAAAAAAAASVSSSSSSSSDGRYAVYAVSVPLRQTNSLGSPWEELTSDVRLALRCAGGACLGTNTPSVSWTAHWASDKVHMGVEKHMLTRALTLLDAAAAYPINEGSVGTLEALGLHTHLPEATYALSIRRLTGVRALQLLVAASQLGFIVYCLMHGAGQVLWVVVMSRLLCMRAHMTRRMETRPVQ